jgi:DNA-binding IclR family transcriptional regulator
MDAGTPPAGTRPTASALKPTRRSAKSVQGKSAPAREHKLGATARSFAILEHVARSRAPVDVLDIIASLKLPKATAYRLVDWFVCQGYLSREPGRRRLIVGSRLTNLAFGTLLSSMRNDTPHVVLARLVHTLNETCNIGTLLNGEVVYLDRVEAEDWPLRLHYTQGSRVPLHCSAIGKLYWRWPPRRVAAACCKVWSCGASPSAPSPTARGSTLNCGKSVRSRCRSTARSISWA